MDKFKSYFTPEDWDKLQKEIKYRLDLIKNEGLPNSAEYAKLYLKNLNDAENPYYFLLTAISMVKPITADGAYWYEVSQNLGKSKSSVNEVFLKMQKRAGLITESQYRKLTEENSQPTHKSKVDWYYINDNSDYPGPKGRTVPNAKGFDNPKKYKETELYIKKGTKGYVSGTKFTDEDGNDVEYKAEYFEKISK